MTDSKWGDEKPILIVDDEQDMCWALEQIVRSGGFAARKALSAQEALCLMETDSFRGVFLDAKLPDMEGLELARRIRKIDAQIPVVMVSGYFYRDDVAVQEALAGGLITGFIAKPFRRDEILQAMMSTDSHR
jgi:DNA-binding NtrC family response regulator